MDAFTTIKIAEKHVAAKTATMQSSAELCLADANALYSNADFYCAQQRALKAIAYCVGIMHPDYIRCQNEY